jgi:psp operon transcriptional activator
VTLPPLRVREGDVPVLAEHFARRMASELGWPHWPGFSPAAAETLTSYDWPGNVRELRNVVERAVYRWDDPETPVDAIQFDPFDSPWRPSGAKPPAAAADTAEATETVSAPVAVKPPAVDCDDFRTAVLRYEKALLEDALKRCRFNQRATALALKLSYDQLRHALRRHDLLDRQA